VSPDADPLATGMSKVKKVTNRLGFKVMLAWHYIVLFTPLFAEHNETFAPDFVIKRQLALYFTLTVTFFVLMLFGKFLLEIKKSRSSLIMHTVIGLFSMAATLSAIIAMNNQSISTSLQLGCVIALGVSEAISMYLWIHYFMESKTTRPRRALAIDMIGGVLIAFFALSLQQPLSLIAIVGMPGIAAFFLMANWSSERQRLHEPDVVFSKLAKRILLIRFIKNHIPSFLFAFAFGLMQGGLIELHIVFFMAPKPVALLGIIVAGLAIYFIHETPNSHEDIDLMHRFALLPLVMGVLGLSFFRTIDQVLISQAALLVGFNLFDFGALVLSMSMTRRLGLYKVFYTDGGRALVYLGFTLGIISGFVACLLVGGAYADVLLYIIGGVAIMLLVITVIMPLDKQDGSELMLSESDECATATAIVVDSSRAKENPDGSSDGRGDMPWRRLCKEVARTYQLSRRETEVFLLLAKGRNAEYIQGKLVISLHTAKTHIANIYHKLEVHSLQEMLDLIESFKAH
jgi:DNA-binding CsgD family transcriptional regulator